MRRLVVCSGIEWQRRFPCLRTVCVSTHVGGITAVRGYQHGVFSQDVEAAEVQRIVQHETARACSGDVGCIWGAQAAMAASQNRGVLFFARHPTRTLRGWPLAARSRAARNGTSPMPAEDRLCECACLWSGEHDREFAAVSYRTGLRCSYLEQAQHHLAAALFHSIHASTSKLSKSHKHRSSAPTTSAPARTRSPSLSWTLAQATANPLALTSPPTPPARPSHLAACLR